ncbi:MAG: cytochrome b N-terminal domain-containing protein [Kofleriaceae bacterium]
MLAAVRDWLDERTGYRAAVAEWRRPLPGGASLAHTLGFSLALLLVLQAVTGALLAFYYSPSTGSAWASVAYIEDQVTMGAFVRGVHRWGMSAVVIVAGLQLVVAAVRGGYRRPREVQWWLGLLIIGVLVGYSISGFVLRWDQYGYWATKVELGYVTDSPVIGQAATQILQGGNDFGNLTLTRFYALHVAVLPALTLILVALYRRVGRTHGPVPARGAAQAAWPYQAIRNVAVGAAVVIALALWSRHAGGAGLDGPADPTSVYDARPQWYFRPLFALVNMFGSLRTIIALGLPAVVLGGLAALPVIDGRPGRPRRHALILAVMGLGLAGAVIVSTMSYRQDAADEDLAKRTATIAGDARRARALAKANGVPSPGGLAVFTTTPFYEARRLWGSECASCHDDGQDRKAPLLGPGLAGRAHLRSLLLDPSAPEHFGRSPKIATSENAMPKTEVAPDELDALVELIYAETGAPDVDAAKVARGKQLFEDGECANCHNRTGTDASSGPNLAGYGTRAYWESMLRDSGSPHLFGALDDMPAYDDQLEPNSLRALAEYLVWLRTATPDDVKALTRWDAAP